MAQGKITVSVDCVNPDTTDANHNRCPGAIYHSVFAVGTRCECPCHTLPRCFATYISDHGVGVYDCDLHEGHGGDFHRNRFIYWSTG